MRSKTSRNIWIGIFVFVAVAIVVRALAPGFILRQLNATLSTMSPQYTAHINDLDISLWRMAYGFEGIEVKQKKPEKTFLKVEHVDVSLAWRELLRFHIVVDIDVDQAHLNVDPEIIALLTERPKPSAQEASKAKSSLVPFRIERFRLFNSSVIAKDIPSLPLEQAFRITGINASLLNLVPSKEDPKTEFTAHAKVMDKAPLKAEGDAHLLAKPLRWEVDAELKDFELTTVNAMLARLVPLSFDKGVMEAYAVVRSDGQVIKGSVKPFIDNAEFIGDKRDFKGFKHGLIEVASAIASFILENRNEGSVATQVDFDWSGGKFNVDVAKAIEQSFRHRFREPLTKKVN